MHITINTITRKVIIHDLTLTKTELVVKMLEAIGEKPDDYQVVNEDFNYNDHSYINITPIKNDGAAMS